MRLQTGFRPEPLFHRQYFLHAPQIQRTPGTAATCIAQVSIAHRRRTCRHHRCPRRQRGRTGNTMDFLLDNHCTFLSALLPFIYLFMLVTALLSLAANARFHYRIPHRLEPEEWTNLTRTAARVLHSSNTRREIVYALLIVHGMQTLFCFP